MKLNFIMLLVTFVLVITTTFAPNTSVKKEFGKGKKSDIDWIYGKNTMMDIL